MSDVTPPGGTDRGQGGPPPVPDAPVPPGPASAPPPPVLPGRPEPAARPSAPVDADPQQMAGSEHPRESPRPGGSTASGAGPTSHAAPPPGYAAPPPGYAAPPPGYAAPPPGQAAPGGYPGTGRSGGWYEGPLTIDQLKPGPESMGASMLRTGLRALTALTVFGVGGLMLFFAFGIMATALVGALAGQEPAGGTQLETSFYAGSPKSDQVLLGVPIDGLILGEGGEGGGGLLAGDVTYGYDIKDKLAAAAERDDLEGVVLLVNSPGGTIFGSRAINEAVRDYRDATGKPVIAFVAGISASGGMYAMTEADTIIADHGTLIGSIGVLFGPFQTYDDVVAIDGGLFGGGVETRGGISSEFISAGRGKDIGNPWRTMTAEERSVLETGVERAYEDFVDAVAAGRNLDRDFIVDRLGAMIYDEATALDLGLIDEVADRDTAFERAAIAAGLAPGDWRIDRLDRASTGLFGLGLDHADDPSAVTSLSADHEAARRASLRSICSGPTMLAYYGNPAALCR